jgi:hypothetical protein
MSIQVLVTCRSLHRCNALAERLSVCNRKVGAMVWLTTMAQAITDPLDSIWLTPRDYGKEAARFEVVRQTNISQMKDYFGHHRELNYHEPSRRMGLKGAV